MGSSREKASSGRANPNGIPYYNLSTSLDSYVMKVDQPFSDYITIAEFKLQEGPLNVISHKSD